MYKVALKYDFLPAPHAFPPLCRSNGLYKSNNLTVKFSTVKHIYFASIKFLRFEKNGKIKYMQIFGTAHHRKFICIEYQHFRSMISNIFVNM